MNLSRVELKNGARLSVINTDRFKSELITFTISLPLTKQTLSYGMLLVGILKRGTESYPNLASLNRRLDELYDSSVDVRSTRLGKNLQISVSADVLSDRYIPDGTDVLGETLDIIKEILFHPLTENGVFFQKYFEQEKDFLIDLIDASVNNTRGYANTRLTELMLSSDKEFPTLEETRALVESIDNSELTDFYFSTVLHSPAEFFYVGDADEASIRSKISKHFSEWEPSLSHAPVLPYTEPVCDYVESSEKMPVSQGKLAIGFKIGACITEGSTDHFSAILFNEIFGGSPASKLFMNVREKLSLCYYCSSSYNQYMGTVTVSSGIENKNYGLAKNAILNELNDIKNGRISDVEFNAAKLSLENSYRQINDSPYDIQSFYGNRGFFSFTEDVESARAGIAAITKDDVIRIANTVICDSIFYVEPNGEEDGSDE